jgi:hypothetical protein
MIAPDAVVFIDTQQYVDLYRIASGKDLLAPLQEQKDHIFVTEQLVSEVNRHKLSEAIAFFQRECQIGKLTGGKLPDHLFDGDGSIVREIRQDLKAAGDIVKTAAAKLEKAIADTLHRISISADVVSKALASLFATGAPHTDEEMQRARDRNARAIPPGKSVGLIGDELNWEQLLSFIRKHAKKRIWIISRDRDYCILHGKERVFLQPSLHGELIRVVGPGLQVYAFANIPDGMRHFVETTGVVAEKLPDLVKADRIKKEQERVPPEGWVPLGSGSGSGMPPHLNPALFGMMPGSGYVQTTTTPPPYYSSGGSYDRSYGAPYSANSAPLDGPYSAPIGAHSAPLRIYWEDGEITDMVPEDGCWVGPRERIDAKGQRVHVPHIRVARDEVMVDDKCYPVETLDPFLANIDHGGTLI